jgi:hypothetical protein
VLNLPLVWRKLGKYEAAEQVSRRAYEGYEQQQGANHGSMLITL